MFAGYQNEKIVLVADTREELENAPCIVFDNIEELPEDYELYEGEYVTVTEAAERKAEAAKQARIKELQEQLDNLDLKAIRALRAIQAGVGTEADAQRIAYLEEQAEEVREQLRQLGE